MVWLRGVKTHSEVVFFVCLLKMRYIWGNEPMGREYMRLVLKMSVLLIVTMIRVLIWCCAMVLSVLAYVSGIAGSIMALLAAFVFFFSERQQALLLMMGAWLVSPLGLPMAAVWLLGRLQDVCDVIMDSAA